VAIVGGIADAGLTVVGQREYVLLDDRAARRRLVGTIAGLRLAFAPVGVLLAAGFGLAAGYPGEMVTGTLVAGAGVVCASAAISLSLPLSAELRLGRIALAELSRQVVLTAAIAVFVAVDADLGTFFAAQLLAGAAMLAVTIRAVDDVVAPRLGRDAWRLLREAAPVAASLVVNVVYVRALVIVVSLFGTAIGTGLFGTATRVVEPLLALPYLLAGSAFPVLAAAGGEDPARFARGVRRLAEAALVAAVPLVLGLVIAAEPVIEILGGEDYGGAVDVLRIQALVLLAAFLTQVWTLALVAVRAQRELVTVNATALLTVLVLGAVLVPAYGAEGAAIAAVVGETALAVLAAVLLLRKRQGSVPGLSHVARVGFAAALGAACALLPVPALAAALLAVAVYAVAAWRLGAVPAEATRLLLSIRR
jgi:O-antigen/teichoic acid export membrane protein